ncbi:glycosyltransferase [Elusimicrobiota bacterium]
MHIGIVIARIGGVDGVALETEKWMAVLERMGHRCSILTGQLEADFPGATLLPQLSLFHPDCERDQEDAFFGQKADEKTLLDRLEQAAVHIEHHIGQWIAERGVEVLLTENSTTLPCHLSMGMALKRVMEKTGIPAVSHNHDFHWERGERYRTRYGGVRAVVDDCFPPVLPNLRHAVINSYCEDSLKQQLGIEAVVVPNVMDFKAPFGAVDDYNRDLPLSLGLREGDIPLFQITRIVRRKGIETAVELVRRLGDPRIKLVVTGTAKDDLGGGYYRELAAQVERDGLEDRVLFAGDRFDAVRRTAKDGKKVYALSDAYAHCRAMTYFSTYEGFGNAFVEAVAAKVPVFVNNYEPVYWPDIGSKGFKTVQIEGGRLTDEAVARMKELVYDPERARDLTEFNFRLGEEHFSYEVLEGILGRLFRGTGDP